MDNTLCYFDLKEVHNLEQHLREIAEEEAALIARLQQIREETYERAQD